MLAIRKPCELISQLLGLFLFVVHSAINGLGYLSSDHFDNTSMVFGKGVTMCRINRENADNVSIRYQRCTETTSKRRPQHARYLSQVKHRIGIQDRLAICGDPS
jgi:hypothetical protein